MAIQIHSYLAPSDDEADRAIDRAVFVLQKYETIGRNLNAQWVARDIVGSIYKSRAAFRNGKEPVEIGINPFRKWRGAGGPDAIAAKTIPIDTAKAASCDKDQIESAVLALILTDPAQVGSVIVND